VSENEPNFLRNRSPSSRLMSEPSKSMEFANYLHADFLLGSLTVLEDGSDVLLRNVGSLSPVCTELCSISWNSFYSFFI
jgi:hypothetical protein